MKPETTVQFCDRWNNNVIPDSDNKTESVICSCISWYPALKTDKSSNIKSIYILLVIKSNIFIHLLIYNNI